MEPSRPLRADAVRNRTKILDAAREQITRLGPDVPMDTIAEAAGVAVGTLYRHFPTKTDLVTAVIGEHSELITQAIEAAAERVAGGADAMSEISALMSHIVEAAASDRAVKAAAQDVGAEFLTPEQESRSRAATTAMIEAAQRDGRLREDVTADDFYLLILTAPTAVEPAVRARWLQLFLAGFTTSRN
ncbi:helix-turn-helix domain-containing protein [Amycolatopsis rhabdoformis]|uniref:Helix-turn-helix domain-containing protein n=1 Tax=Amycolatopsis rhabdoformis TaxID=1448059 RepID=A0ABZ1IM98_9PSEU|nr:helix-turn-helix domain-containing protein [Amycolatopsis rhabdoformis]WSE34878.1 helix-turn-helix domain-containing protein [Amycolatopsis rhabdoformis]